MADKDRQVRLEKHTQQTHKQEVVVVVDEEEVR